eukprot:340465-Rhodomonas_salina.8
MHRVQDAAQRPALTSRMREKADSVIDPRAPQQPHQPLAQRAVSAHRLAAAPSVQQLGPCSSDAVTSRLECFVSVLVRVADIDCFRVWAPPQTQTDRAPDPPARAPGRRQRDPVAAVGARKPPEDRNPQRQQQPWRSVTGRVHRQGDESGETGRTDAVGERYGSVRCGVVRSDGKLVVQVMEFFSWNCYYAD